MLARVAAGQQNAETALRHRLPARRQLLELLKRDFANIDEAMHDLKEAARALASMGEEGTRAIDRVAVNRADQIDRAVQSFNAMAHTGNPSIDVLLSEQNLRCQSNGVSLNAMVDGSALWFMDAPSIYAFFGNLLDAAIGMAEGVTDQFRRAVTLDVRTRGSMVAVTLTGCYEGVALRSDSLLLRSAGRVANRYRGELSVQASGGVLSVLDTDQKKAVKVEREMAQIISAGCITPESVAKILSRTK